MDKQTNKAGRIGLVSSQIDRTPVNEEWIAMAPATYVHYKPEMWYDHCPAIVVLDTKQHRRAKAFKFFDMWGSHPSFKELVANAWQVHIPGL